MRILESRNALCGLCRSIGNLCQLVGGRIRRDSNVAHHDDTVLTILLLVREDQHGTADAGYARRAFDDLQSRTERIASGRKGT